MKISDEFWLKNIICLLVLTISISGCKKDNGGITNSTLAELTTDTVTIVGILTAQCGGNITSEGGANVTDRGICFSEERNPTTDDSKIKAGIGSGIFVVNFSLDGLTVGSTCYVRAYATNGKGTSYGNEVSFKIPQTVFTIGQLYQGGVIAYIDSTHLHGIISTISDQEHGAEWGCQGMQVSGASGITIGTGGQNTIDIETSCPSFGTAADLCSGLISEGYNDWYLPSKDELNQLYINRDIIGGFSTDIYWSSSEHNNTNSWAQMFSSGEQQPAFKSHKNSVRAVRSF